jgi:hypothetical protein
MAQRGLNDNTRRQPTNPNPQDDAELFVLFLFFCSQALRHHVGCRTIEAFTHNFIAAVQRIF